VPELQVAGKPGGYTRETTTRWSSNSRAEFPLRGHAGGDTLIGGGQATGCLAQPIWRLRPAHHLKQFLPKYSSLDEVQPQGQGGWFRQLVSYFRNRTNWALNVDLPSWAPGRP